MGHLAYIISGDNDMLVFLYANDCMRIRIEFEFEFE